MNRRSFHIAIGTAWLMLSSIAGVAQELERTPAETKALYTAFIAEYTTWPAPDSSGVPTASGDFVIGVVGSDPNYVMDPILARIKSAKGMHINERRVAVFDVDLGDLATQRAVDAALGDCSMLFFSADSQTQWVTLKPYLDRRPILTVSEMPGFAEQGGMVEYEYDPRAQRIYMIFNMAALKQAGLTVSARLLSLKVSRLINQGADQ